MKSTLISSQRHLDPARVDAKRVARDYAVLVSPTITIDGESYRVVIDGHHALAAARADGVEAEITEATVQHTDKLALLPDVEAYLEASWIDADWYDVETGLTVWV